MKYKETCSKGSFIAWGTGFKYKYNSDHNSLHITGTRYKKPLLTFQLDADRPENPLGYVEDIDKATQIYALMFSNNTTLELSDIFEERQLLTILKNSTKIARYSYDLQHLEFARFSAQFCDRFSLKNFEIKHLQNRSEDENMYLAKLRTQQNNSTSAISRSLHGIMRDLSLKTVRDLIATEDWNTNESAAAHNLLTVSTNLNTISRVLDKRFSPYKYVARHNKADAKKHKKQNKNSELQQY